MVVSPAPPGNQGNQNNTGNAPTLPSGQQDEQNGDDNTGSGAVTGGIIAAVLFAMFVAAIAVYWKINQRQSQGDGALRTPASQSHIRNRNDLQATSGFEVCFVALGSQPKHVSDSTSSLNCFDNFKMKKA